MDPLQKLREEVDKVKLRIAQLEAKNKITERIEKELVELIQKVETLQKKIRIVDMLKNELYNVNEVCNMIIEL
jgi:hypothetical protein